MDAERIVRKLVEGDEDDRAETLDELAAIWRTHDLSALAARILETLPRYEPEAGGSDKNWRIRAVLVGALVYAYDGNRADGADAAAALARHVDPKRKPYNFVRWEARAAFLRRGTVSYPVPFPEDPEEGVNALLLRHSNPDAFEGTLRSYLQSGNWIGAQQYLRALEVAPMSGIVKDVCAAMAPGPDHYRLDALIALTEPSVVQQSAAVLQTMYGSAKTAEFVASTGAALTVPNRRVTRRLASLLSRLEQPQVRAALRRANATALLQALGEILGRVRIAGYASDTTSRTDELGITTEVQTLCAVMLSTDVEPPLSIGLFGDWGTGKSFFMDRMYEEVQRMAAAAGNPSKLNSIRAWPRSSSTPGTTSIPTCGPA